MTGPALDLSNDLGVSPRAGSYEAQLSEWARSKVAAGADPIIVKARVGDLVHAYRRSLADKPLTSEPESMGEKFSGALGSAYQGLTMGAGNKIAAAIQAGGLSAGDPGGVVGAVTRFPAALKEQTDNLQQFEGRHPVASRAIEMAGSVPTVLATGGGVLPEVAAGSRAGRIAKQGLALAKQGAEYGGASGALSANDVGDIAPGALRGAAEGAVLAPVAGVLGGGVAKGIKKLRPTPAAEAARSSILGALETGGVDVPKAAASVPAQSPTTAMELGSRNVASVARQARNVPTANAGQTIDRFLQERAAGTGQRIERALGDASGQEFTDINEPIDALVARRSAQAKPEYQAAYAHGELRSPEIVGQIQTLRRNPVFERAWQRGQQMLDLEGGGASRPANVPEAMWNQTVPENRPQLLKALGVESSTNPTVAQLDAWKKGLDAVIESGRGSDNALSRSEARLYRQKLNDLLGKVDAEVPAYAKARQNFAGHSEVVDAAEAGAQHFSPSSGSAEYLHRTLPERFGSDAEQEAYQRNALNAFAEKVRNLAANPDLPEAARGTNIVQRLVGTEDAGRRLRMLFPDEASYEAFLGKMEQESLYPKTNAFLRNQSSTAAQLAEGGASPSTWRDAATAAMGSPYGKARLVTRGLQKMVGGGQGVAPDIANAVGEHVTLTGDRLTQALHQMLAERAAKQAALRRAVALTANTVAAHPSQNNP